jgi:hypothetical protein
VEAGLGRTVLAGLNLAFAQARERLGRNVGNLPQYASATGPILIAGEQYFEIVLFEIG